MTPTTYYIVQASSNDENWNADCDYAILTFTGELLLKLRTWRTRFLELQREISDLHTWYIRNFSTCFVSTKFVESVLGEGYLEVQTPTRVLIAPDLESANGVYSDALALNDYGFWWEAQPKHSSITVENWSMDWDWLTQCRNCGLKKEEHAKKKCLFAETKYHAYA